MHDPAPEVLIAVAADARLTEDLALALLKHTDLPREALEALSKNGSLMRQRKVRMAVVTHQRHAATCVGAHHPPSLYV